VPLLVVAAATLAAPRSERAFGSGAVAGYALTPGAWQQVVEGRP
jgi:hypothetical protein